MKKGKIAAQVAHASMGVILDAFKDRGIIRDIENDRWSTIMSDPTSFLMTEWLNGSFTKICLKVNSLEQLESYEQKALQSEIPTFKITDNGSTVFDGIPTVTCLAVGPHRNEVLDPLFWSLKLL